MQISFNSVFANEKDKRLIKKIKTKSDFSSFSFEKCFSSFFNFGEFSAKIKNYI